MAQNRTHITIENIEEWLASTGFLFPSTELELSRFNKLFGEKDDSITGREIDPIKIIKDKSQSVPKVRSLPSEISGYVEYKMVARKGGAIPQHILDKIKKNQQDSRKNDSGSEKKENQ